MKTKNALIRCILGVVVASAMLVVTWSTTSARFSPNTTTTTVGSSSKVAPPVLSNFTRIPFRNILTPATIATDRSDYHPGDRVTVTGSGFLAGETISLTFIEDPNHDGPHMLSATADSSGNLSDNNFIVSPEDVGTTFTLNAVGLASGQTASTTFTDTQCDSGTGVVTVVGNGGSCVSGTPPNGSGPYNWEVVEGGSYTMTISGVTECGTGDTEAGAITVFIQNSDTGNFCFNATKTSTGTYTGTFTMPNPACNTSPISYKCGNVACDNPGSSINARGPGGACTVHLRASTFDGSCNRTGDDTNCQGGGGGTEGCLLNNVPLGRDLGCNPDPSLYACNTAGITVTPSGGCTPSPVTCTPGTPQSTGGCGWTVTNIYSATCGAVTCEGRQTFTWKVDTEKPVITPTGTTLTLGCNPTADQINAALGSATATDNCDTSVTVNHSDSGVTSDGCNRSQTRTFTATDSCGNPATAVSRTVTWTEDTTPPVITPTGTTLTLGCNPTADQINAALGSATATDNCSVGTPTPTTGDVMINGCNRSQTRTWNVSDACGNPATAVSRTVTWKVDTTPPTITCPGDMTVNGGGACCKVVTYTAGFNDNCGLATFGCSPPSGSSFCVGTTTVTCTATDACGNVAVPCSFNVTVKGQICVSKFYDANANGSNNGEAGISGWKITVSDGQVGYTGSNGSVCFDVLAGTYTVREVLPPGNWVATTPTSQNVTVNSTDSCSVSVTFGNYCFSAPSNGLTLGFWTNRNGQNILEANTTTHNAWVTLLNSPCGSGAVMRNADGTIHTFSTYTDLKNWLNGATATNMAYMLSAQLAANLLDEAFNGLNGGTGVIVPGKVTTQNNVCIVPFLSVIQPITCGNTALLSLTAVPGTGSCNCTSNNGLVTIDALQARACCLLNAYGNTTPGTTQRTYQECVKDILDMINNNGNPSGGSAYPCGPLTQYINPGASSCPFTYPQ